MVHFFTPKALVLLVCVFGSLCCVSSVVVDDDDDDDAVVVVERATLEN